MKTTLLLLFLTSLSVSAQKKDYTQKQLLKNKRVIEFATSQQTEKKNIVNFLKCLKSESKINTYKELPFFTGNYPLIIDQRVKEHNNELWEVIIQECKDNTIFLTKN